MINIPTDPYPFEYLWLDGYNPANIRGKTRILSRSAKWEGIPWWSFDGSSTKQATGDNSDCALMPIDHRHSSLLGREFVLCEVMDNDRNPHPSNTRSHVPDNILSQDLWLAFEQEYVILDHKTNLPLGWREDVPQGEFYCGVGTGNVAGRAIAERHLGLCLDAGLHITGINAEVLIGQWEFQIFGTAINACDDLIIARYLLHLAAEEHGCIISFHPKPLKGDWNGSGCHVNFSTSGMRNGTTNFDDVIAALAGRHDKHIAVYGAHNDQRLLGTHETSSMETFTAAFADRTASVRIPLQAHLDGKGYLEDRRPAANCDPYLVAKALISTLSSTNS